MLDGDSKEVWTPVDGFPHYEVSTYGNVYNARWKRNITPRITKEGYVKVSLSDGDIRREIHLNQVVAKAFLGDYVDGIPLKHIDGDRTNNRVENLKPLSINRLNLFKYRANHIRGSRVRVIETGQVFRNTYSAARHFQIDPSVIYRVLRGERNRTLGMRFEYFEGDDPNEDY